MSKKSFKIARKPGQAPQKNKQADSVLPISTAKALRERKGSSTAKSPAALSSSPTTRKTIEVPEDYFYQVKMRAVQRKVKEKDLWAEILAEYFKDHPAA